MPARWSIDDRSSPPATGGGVRGRVGPETKQTAPSKATLDEFCVLMVMGNRVVCCALSSFEAVSLVRI